MRLKLYQGHLSGPQAAEGINTALKNARRLATDAGLMLDLESYPTAASLAVLSIEEVGKVGIIRGFALARDPSEIKKWWKRYRTHTWKSAIGSIPAHPLRDELSLATLAEIAPPGGREAKLFNIVKQIGFYTDCADDGNWTSPDEMIDERLATNLVSAACSLCQMSDVTSREMDLWFSIVGAANKNEIQSAMVHWHVTMVEEGLARQSHEEFEGF